MVEQFLLGNGTMSSFCSSFVQTTLNHPELFQFPCPKCGNPVLPYRYAGSPLSGRLDLEGYCHCGWKGIASVSGWFRRGEALREQIAADKGQEEHCDCGWKGFETVNSR